MPSEVPDTPPAPQPADAPQSLQTTKDLLDRIWVTLDDQQRRRVVASARGIAKKGRRMRYLPGPVVDLAWRPTKHLDAALQGLELVAAADPRVVRRERQSGVAQLPCKVMAAELVMHAPGTEDSAAAAASSVSLSMMYTSLLSRLVEHVNESDDAAEESGTLVWHGARDSVASLARSRGSGVACDHAGLHRLQDAARALRDRFAVPAA